MKRHIGMTKEMCEHISKNLYSLELDLENGKILNRKANTLRNGYPRLRLDGRDVYQHQIFAVARWGIEPCIGMTINHISEVKTDNSSRNIELLTIEDNLRVATRRGIPKQPIKATNIDTGEEIVFESQMEAARQLKLRQGNIFKVLKGECKRAGKYKFERVA